MSDPLRAWLDSVHYAQAGVLDPARPANWWDNPATQADEDEDATLSLSVDTEPRDDKGSPAAQALAAYYAKKLPT